MGEAWTGKGIMVSPPLVTTAAVDFRTAYYLWDRFPQSVSFAKRSFTHAMGQLAELANPRLAFRFIEAQQYVKTHPTMNPVSSSSCAPRILLNF